MSEREPISEALDYARPGGTIVLAGVKGFKPVPDFVSDLIDRQDVRERVEALLPSALKRSQH